MAIANNNVQNVKFLRNGSVYNTHADALNALKSFQITAEQDGTAILARYNSTENEQPVVKTLVGWVYSGATGSYITIQDVEGASGDIAALLGDGVTTANTVTDQLTALSGTAGASSAETSVEGAKAYAKDYTDEQISNLDVTAIEAPAGAYIKSVSQSDGKVSATTEDMPTVNTITEAGKPIIAVAEDKGTIAASAGTINAEFVNVTGETFTAGTVQGVLEEIDSEYKAAIEGLDKPDSAAAKKFVTSVSEENGIINVSRGEITSSGKTIVLTDNADGGVNFEVNIDGVTLEKNENGVISVTSSALVQYEGDDDTIQIGAVSDGKRIVSSPLTIQKVTTGLSEEVKEEYRLIGHSGNTIGDPVKIYKDSHIVSINYITTGEHAQNLEYVYIDVSGNTQTTYVDMSELVLETEFASGVTVTDGIAHGVVDSTSEGFLTVGEGGFKLSGVQDAINTAVGTAVSGLDASVSAETAHVTVKVDEVDGKLTAVTLTEDNIANAGDLAELSGKTITEVASENNSITATLSAATDGTKHLDIVTDASKIKMSGFTSTDVLSGITPASSITEAFGEVDKVITENEQVTAAALNDLNTRVNTVSGDVDTIKTQYVSGVSVNGTAVTVSDHVAPIAISAATSATTATSTEAITVDTDANGNITLGLATIDCGTY